MTKPLALLAEGTSRLECASLEAQYANLLDEHGHHDAALRALERYERFSPIRSRRGTEWLAGRRCDLHARLGNRDRSLEYARNAGSGFYKKLAERMEQARPQPRRVRLAVEFVGQHHLTCAPATLTALSRFWAVPVQHVEVAERICYDGTPDHGERAWAEENGFAVVEFRVTWEAAVRLLERGVPFAMATVETTTAHLQAIIGFDEDRGTLLIRGPSQPTANEASAAWLDQYRSSGPRGMALVPRQRAGPALGATRVRAALRPGIAR